MLDIRWMRENREALAEAMRKLNDTEAPWELALELDEQRRSLLSSVEALRAELNTGSKQIGLLFREKKVDEANALKARMGELGDEIAAARLCNCARWTQHLRMPCCAFPTCPSRTCRLRPTRAATWS